MTKRLEISRDIAAPPDLVYAAISDVTRMGEWSEECHDCEWHEGYDGPEVGAKSPAGATPIQPSIGFAGNSRL